MCVCAHDVNVPQCKFHIHHVSCSIRPWKDDAVAARWKQPREKHPGGVATWLAAQCKQPHLGAFIGFEDDPEHKLLLEALRDDVTGWLQTQMTNNGRSARARGADPSSEAEKSEETDYVVGAAKKSEKNGKKKTKGGAAKQNNGEDEGDEVEEVGKRSKPEVVQNKSKSSKKEVQATNDSDGDGSSSDDDVKLSTVKKAKDTSRKRQTRAATKKTQNAAMQAFLKKNKPLAAKTSPAKSKPPNENEIGRPARTRTSPRPPRRGPLPPNKRTRRN